MARKDYTPEQAIGMLREAEVRLSQGEKIGKICRGFGISEQSYYRWRRLYGGLKVDQAKRLPFSQARLCCACAIETCRLGAPSVSDCRSGAGNATSSSAGSR